jgi:hypothetical protein
MPPRDDPTRRSRSRRSWLGRAIAFAAGCLVVLVVVEGASSLLLLAKALWADAPGAVAERRHTQYDPDLGWVHTPGLRLPDFYGPGRTLTINAQGFRGEQDVARRVPPGKLRIICSGDSFTLGYGVGDGETWCAQLAARDPRFESVNMGQGGYGIGQAYLWYARDGSALEHHLHVFAFITADFARMLSERFQGYGKPVLRVRQGELVTENVPVPRIRYAMPWLLSRRKVLDELRSLQLLRSLKPKQPGAASGPNGSHEELPQVASRIFAALQRLNAQKGSELVLVYLPMRAEHGGALDERLPRFVRKAARMRGIAYVDLIEELGRLPAQEARSLYIRPEDSGFPGAEDHLNPRGNAWVAARLHARIAQLPSLQEKPE